MKKLTRGLTLIELLIYMALLSTILLVTYDLFVQVNLNMVSASSSSEVYLNAQRVVLDLEQTIRKAQSIDLPALGKNGKILSLDAGNIVYEIDDQKRLVKIEAGEVNSLTDNGVVVDSIVFETLGPSTIQPTIKISFALKAIQQSEDQDRKISFQTSVTKR